MSVTIKDVAKKAGVTPAVVSRVLNNDSTLSIKNETRDNVIRAASELNYQPNSIARSLRSKTTGTLGMLVPDIANPYFVNIIKGAQDYALENDMCLILINTDDIWENEKKLINVLINKKVDGILYLSAHLDIKANTLLSAGLIPYVLVNRNSVNSNTSYVGTDNFAGAYMAVQHLLSLGHTKIAHISGPLYTDTASGRLQGYFAAIKAAGFQQNPRYIIESSFTFEGGHSAAKELLSLENPPTAIFAANDLIAMGTIVSADEMNLSVPEDLSVIGMNDIWTGKYFMPPLTTISYDAYKMGSEACKMLINQIANNNQDQLRIILEPSLVIRKSTAQVKK